MRTIAMEEMEVIVEPDLEFEAALRSTLMTLSGGHAPGMRPRIAMPQRMVQRMVQRLVEAADLEVAVLPRPQVLTFREVGRTPRNAQSFWTAIAAHAAAIALIAYTASHMVRTSSTAVKVTTLSELTAPPPPPLKVPRTENIGGGGGQHDIAPLVQGHLPKYSEQQLLAPKVPPVLEPKLAAEPTLAMQKDLRLADNDMPNLGLPTSSLRGVSLGNGLGTGLGSGNGAGVGPGSGGNIGGGIMHVGGSVRAPIVVRQVDAEYSEEARRAKFSGNVEVYLWVDEQGNPSHIRIARGAGMGLDEKAMEAVAQYKFKPATQNGKPVRVDLYVDVGFQIF